MSWCNSKLLSEERWKPEIKDTQDNTLPSYEELSLVGLVPNTIGGLGGAVHHLILYQAIPVGRAQHVACNNSMKHPLKKLQYMYICMYMYVGVHL